MLPGRRFGRTGITAGEYYENVSKILAPEYRGLDAQDVEHIMAQVGIDAEYLESFLRRRRRARAVRALRQALPVVGGIAGGVLGGQAGASAGQMVGGLVGTALGPRQSTPAVGSATPQPSPQLPQTPSPVPSPFPLQQLQTPGGSPAAAQLLQVLQRPEVLNALMAMSMGTIGAPSIAVGQTQVRPSALTNLVSELADQATAEYNEMERVIRPYRGEEDYAGETIDDPAESAIRAAGLLQRLNETALEGTPPHYPLPVLEFIPEDDIEDQISEELLFDEFYSDMENW